MRYYEEELEVLIKAGAKVVEIASFEWERVHGFANYVAEDLNVDWFSWSSVSGLKVWTWIFTMVSVWNATIESPYDAR